MPTDTVPANIEELAERLAKLEAENKRLKEAPYRDPEGKPTDVDPNAASQAVIKKRKNSNPDLVQVTAKGNVRTCRDPSDQFMAEQATAGQYGDEALAAAAHAADRKENLR